MRALGEPDAFPSGDLILRRQAGCATPRSLEQRSSEWRPWRAYAVMLLWQSAQDHDFSPEDECAPTSSFAAIAARCSLAADGAR